MSRCEAAVNSTVLAQQNNWFRDKPIRRCSRTATHIRITRSGEWSENVHRLHVCTTHRRSEYAFPFDHEGSIVLRIPRHYEEGDRTFRTLMKYLREEDEAEAKEVALR